MPRFAAKTALVTLLLAAVLAQADGHAQPPRYDGYRQTSFYVSVRDGTRLAVDLFQPTSQGVLTAEKLPVVWMHTPYNRRTYRGGIAAETYPGFALRLVAHGYHVAVVDFRGVYASFGQNRAYNRGEWLDAARLDAYDITEWLAKQPWSNGRIGMWGCSATGGSQMQAATTAPPSLKAIFPMSAEFDAYSFQVNGGVAPPPGAPLRALPGPAVRDKGAVAVDGTDAAAELQSAIAGHLPDGDAIGDVPFRDSVSRRLEETWWLKSSPHTYVDALRRSGIGVYAAANWDEAGTRHGAFFTFANLPGQARLLVGPATHCAWTQVKTETGFDIVAEELRFFDYWLKGVRNGVMEEPAVTYYTYNAPPATAWRRAARWPLPGEVRTRFHLGERTLTRERVTTAARDTVGFNRLRDVATSTTGPRETAGENVLSYETPVLSDDMEVTGHPVVHLWMTADAPDADVMARLDDVSPDGSVRSYSMHGQFRASHRARADAPYENFALPWHSHRASDARPLVPGTPAEVEFAMLPMSYIFKAGHRLRLTLFFADPAAPAAPDPKTAIAVLRAPDMPSSVTLPIIPATPSVSGLAAANVQAPPSTVKPSATSRAVEPPGPPVPLGPYADVTIDPAEGLATHTVYRPTDLSAFPARDRLPIVVWGNGACRMDGLMFQRFLTKIASHGFLVIAVGAKDFREQQAKAADPAGGAAPGTGTPQRPVGGGSTGRHLIQAIDWAINENTRSGSPLAGKIDTDTVAMMGQSCGGLMAIEAAHDPRVDTLVIWNSGVFNTGMASLTTATKATLATIHSNTAYINGGVSDIAFENSNDDVSRIDQVPVFYGVMKEAGHAATYAHVNGGKFGEVGANWLLWRLKADRNAGAMFDGPDCALCKDPAWTVQKRKMR
jgi:putative CocE/NonD family hydrolase